MPVEQLDAQDRLIGSDRDYLDEAEIAVREALERRDPGAIRLAREQGQLHVGLQHDALGQVSVECFASINSGAARDHVRSPDLHGDAHPPGARSGDLLSSSVSPVRHLLGDTAGRGLAILGQRLVAALATGWPASREENAITPLLPHGKARADDVARALGLSHRSLRVTSRPRG